jgi:hypothetical protein
MMSRWSARGASASHPANRSSPPTPERAAAAVGKKLKVELA